MNLRGRLLFVARVGVSVAGGMELRPITQTLLRRDVKDYPVLLRGYRDTEKKAVHMQGSISARKDGAWTVSNVRVTKKDNERAAYRQETALRAEVVPLRQHGVSEKRCRVTDISVGGACIQCEEEFMPGERLLLKLGLHGDGKVMPLLCVVRRRMRRAGAFEYGCEFLDLTPEFEAIINRAVMSMQSQKLSG